MNKKLYKKIQNWFKQYVQQFYQNYPEQKNNIDLKKYHAKRVRVEIKHLAQQLNLNQVDQYLSQIIALLHDIGRFEQIVKFDTYSDFKSIDHGQLAIKIIKKYELLNELNNSSKKIVYYAISHHNNAKLPPNASKKDLLFAKLLRDADKLDILRLYADAKINKYKANNKALKLELSNENIISMQVYKNLLAGKIIKNKMIKTKNDYNLLLMGWIYDINFIETLNLIKQRKYLKKIYTSLPKHPKIDEVYKKMLVYLEKKLSNN